MADNATIARSLYDAWNRRDFDEMVAAAAPDCKIVMIGSGDTYEGPEGTRRYGTMWADAFPDGKITVENVVAQEDRVVVEFSGTGTHTGTLVTSMGSIPATGRSMTIGMCDVLWFRDGKVTSQHSYLDTGAMMAQLGLLGEQAATTQR
jgi:steroid delta-isomerase-like uncharacterized protein